MDLDWRNDPISKTELEDPYLASDGITYSRHTLEAAMKADPWHRSPVTGEVLRSLCYRNNLIQQLMILEATPSAQLPRTQLQIYDPASNPLPENGGEITWVLPSLCAPKVAELKMKWRLDEMYATTPLVLTARVLRDATGMDWLMHPPPPEEMWDDILELARVFNVHKAVPNPWCLTSARLGKETVESHLLHALGKRGAAA